MDDEWMIIILCVFQDVIQRMLSAHPELLADQSLPPAEPSVIDNLPTVTITQQLIGNNLLHTLIVQHSV